MHSEPNNSVDGNNHAGNASPVQGSNGIVPGSLAAVIQNSQSVICQ